MSAEDFPSFSIQQFSKCQNCSYAISKQAEQHHYTSLIQIRADLNWVLQEVNSVKKQQLKEITIGPVAEFLKEISTIKASLEKQGKAIKGLEKDVDSQRSILFERVKESEKEFREKFQGFVASIDEKLENMQITQNLFGLEADIDQRNMTFGEQQDQLRIDNQLTKNTAMMQLQQPIHSNASFSYGNQAFKQSQISVGEQLKENKEEYNILESQRNSLGTFQTKGYSEQSMESIMQKWMEINANQMIGMNQNKITDENVLESENKANDFSIQKDYENLQKELKQEQIPIVLAQSLSINVDRIPQISNNLMSINDIPEFKPQNKEINQRSLEMIEPENYRTVHCQYYHNQGCGHGDECGYIHVIGYEKNQFPMREFIKIRNDNMRKNYIDAIALVDPNQAKLLANARPDKIKAYCDQHNQRISAQTGQQAPQLPTFGKNKY